MYGPAPGA